MDDLGNLWKIIKTKNNGLKKIGKKIGGKKIGIGFFCGFCSRADLNRWEIVDVVWLQA